MDNAPQYSRGVENFGKFVKVLVRYGWLGLAAVLLIVGLFEWASWKTILALGIAGAVVIALFPLIYGVVLAVDSRRRSMSSEPRNTSPPD
ncbi:hypothetical protein [Enhygromyxa salina]|uniref:hypothetical protein n=1 Tax=Enhygromyxa salina TaxID=215803 RepID=UPI0011B25A72|nr:hypothetical protein [Enhygromyxa salina]